jgi:hypothetical protein
MVMGTFGVEMNLLVALLLLLGTLVLVIFLCLRVMVFEKGKERNKEKEGNVRSLSTHFIIGDDYWGCNNSAITPVGTAGTKFHTIVVSYSYGSPAHVYYDGQIEEVKVLLISCWHLLQIGCTNYTLADFRIYNTSVPPSELLDFGNAIALMCMA